MKPALRPLRLCLALLLAACVDGTSVQQHQHAQLRAPVAPATTIVSVSSPQVVLAKLGAVATHSPDNVWEQLRNRFAMADCDADPAIMTWAKRYTKNPQRFEDQMRAAMPQLVYVEQVAAKHGVAGEFTLLPWVESQYRSSINSKNRPSGIWQIMPTTAHAMGLRVDGGYDGRLDVPASADAVMTLLRRYHDDLGDWRLADYAYNAGEFSVRGLLGRYGRPPEKPAIPRMAVKSVTREHLAKLLALACVVREPGRFNVSLPRLPADQRLEVVTIDRAMPIARAADHAGMPVDALKYLNAGYRNGVVDSRGSSLLLPHSHAEQFRNALSGFANDDASLTASLQPSKTLPTTTDENAPLQASRENSPAPVAPRTLPRNLRQADTRRYTVGASDSLWSIAREHSVTVEQLQRWNHLRTKPLQLGQQLIVSAPTKTD